MKRILFYLVLSFTFIGTQYSTTYAQSNVLQQNLTGVTVDALSNDQLLKIKAQLNSAGVNDDQLREALVQRGMASEEADKFITRLSNIKDNSGSTDITSNPNTVNTVQGVQSNSYEPTSTNVDDQNAKIFGSALFNNANSPINPNLNITPTDDYVLGPKDELQINVSGVSVVSWMINVGPDGSVVMPEGMGKIYLGGKSLGDAKEIIKNKLIANNYPIGRGANVDISITNIRIINISIIGEAARPGNYQVSSMQTVFNALYLCGGPSKIGSYRNISVIRHNKVVETIDLYDYLLKGDVTHNIRLEENDIIYVPVYDVRVEITGEVKRPGIYEVLSGETLKDVVHFAGGITDLAYTSRIKIVQPTDKQKKVIDVSYQDFDKYIPQRGDQIEVDPIIDRFENRVTINGAVFRPGEYELTNGLTLKQLISNSEGLKEDAFMSRAYIVRLKSDNTQEIIPFDVSDIINNDTDITLQREDVVTIPSIFDLRDNPMVTIHGSVRQPGTFVYLEGMNVRDVILQAGGFARGANYNRIEIVRRKQINRADTSSEILDVYKINVDSTLSTKDADFILKPFDVISVYKLPGYEPIRNIKVNGEVIYPGNYTLLKKNERISDIMKRAGGLTPYAFTDGATLIRNFTPQTTGEAQVNQIKSAQIDNAQADANNTNTASVNFSNPLIRNNLVGIDLSYILAHPGSPQDLLLEDGDILSIPKLQQTIRISGEVLLPTTVLYEPGKSLKEYVLSSGGFTQDALPRKARVVAANGRVAGTKSFLFFKRYPKIKPGSEIFIPVKKQRSSTSFDPQTWIGLGTSTASLAAIIYAILHNSK